MASIAMASKKPPFDVPPNMAFDGQSIVALDEHGTKTKHKFMGLGGEIDADVLRLPELSLIIGQNTDRIPNVNVLLQYTAHISKRFDGTLGADTMPGPRSLDF